VQPSNVSGRQVKIRWNRSQDKQREKEDQIDGRRENGKQKQNVSVEGERKLGD
jgi:hypothetical protein